MMPGLRLINGQDGNESSERIVKEMREAVEIIAKDRDLTGFVLIATYEDGDENSAFECCDRDHMIRLLEETKFLMIFDIDDE